MKKTNLTKLTVRRETLRALTGIELTRIAGGGDAAVDKTATCAANCPGDSVVPLPQG